MAGGKAGVEVDLQGVQKQTPVQVVQSPRNIVITLQMGYVTNTSSLARGHTFAGNKLGQKPAHGIATLTPARQKHEKLENSKKSCQIQRMNNYYWMYLGLKMIQCS